MKIIVTRSSGKKEVIDIAGALSVNGSQLTDSGGTDYFFNEDGTYDGWGRAAESPEHADALLDCARNADIKRRN